MSEQPLDHLLKDAEADDDVDDDSTLTAALFPDSAPSSGEWVDIDDVLANPTEDELEEGRILGEGIDPDDDEDGTEVDG
jgi:hypothetical protein